MSAEKNQSPPTAAKEIKAIRLKPSATDYATFVRTAADAMGLTGPATSKTKPDKLLLSLVNLGS